MYPEDSEKLVKIILSEDSFQILDFLVKKGTLDSEYVVLYGIENENYDLVERYGKSTRRLLSIFEDQLGIKTKKKLDLKIFKYMLDTNFDGIDKFIEMYDEYDKFDNFLNRNYGDETVIRLLQRYPYSKEKLTLENRKEYDSKQISTIAPNFTGKLPPHVVDNILRQAGYDSLSLYESMQVLQPILQPTGRTGASEFKQYKSLEQE